MKVETKYPVHELIAKRWSPYSFAGREVADEDLRSLFEAARWAPSSYNEQPWRFIVATMRNRGEFAKFLTCLVEGNQAWAKNAPVLLLGIVARRFERNGNPNVAAEHDLGLAMASLTFEATARGLFVHQMIGIVPETAREVYSIPEGFDALTASAIGYSEAGTNAASGIAERDRERRQRRDPSETFYEGRWGRRTALLGT